MTAGLDVLDAGAAAVDRDDQDVLLLAGGLQRLVGAGGGRLVDRVDEVDRPGPSGAGSPSPCGRLPRRRRSRRGRRSAGRSRRRSCSCRRRRCRSPSGSPGRAGRRRRRWFGVRSSMAILACLPPCAERGLGPLADQLAGLEVVGGEGGVGGVGGSVGVSSAITSMPGLRAFSIVGTIAFESLGVIRMPLAPAAIRFSIAVDLGLVVAVLLAREASAASTPAPWPAACCAPSFILTKNGLVSVLVIRPTIGFSPSCCPRRRSRWSCRSCRHSPRGPARPPHRD